MWSINHDIAYLKIGHRVDGEFREPVCVVSGIRMYPSTSNWCRPQHFQLSPWTTLLCGGGGADMTV